MFDRGSGGMTLLQHCLGTKQQKDGFHIADDIKTCEKIPDPPYTVKNNVRPPLQGLKK